MDVLRINRRFLTCVFSGGPRWRYFSKLFTMFVIVFLKSWRKWEVIGGVGRWNLEVARDDRKRTKMVRALSWELTFTLGEHYLVPSKREKFSRNTFVIFPRHRIRATTDGHVHARRTRIELLRVVYMFCRCEFGLLPLTCGFDSASVRSRVSYQSVLKLTTQPLVETRRRLPRWPPSRDVLFNYDFDVR